MFSVVRILIIFVWMRRITVVEECLDYGCRLWQSNEVLSFLLLQYQLRRCRFLPHRLGQGGESAVELYYLHVDSASGVEEARLGAQYCFVHSKLHAISRDNFEI